MGKADLHMHTTASDGKFTPSEVVEMAVRNKLTTIAITDHDTHEGYYEARRAAEKFNLEIITGAEYTCLFQGREIHILAYGFDPASDEIRYLTKKHKKARFLRAQKIVDYLQQQGFNLNMDEVMAEVTSGGQLNIGRPHIARVLNRKGIVGSYNEAFIRYLNDSCLAKLETEYVDVKQLCELVKNAGGVLILAHPSKLYTSCELDELVVCGLDGLEYLHPSHNYEQQCYYEQYCRKNLLLRTGGSDFHGYGNDAQNLGIVAISSKLTESLKRMIKNRNVINQT